MSKKSRLKSAKSKSPRSLFTGSQAGTVPAPPNTLTVYQLGNASLGIFPSAKELATFKKMVEEVARGKKNAIFVPEGLVKVNQFPL